MKNRQLPKQIVTNYFINYSHIYDTLVDKILTAGQWLYQHWHHVSWDRPPADTYL